MSDERKIVKSVSFNFHVHENGLEIDFGNIQINFNDKVNLTKDEVNDLIVDIFDYSEYCTYSERKFEYRDEYLKKVDNQLIITNIVRAIFNSKVFENCVETTWQFRNEKKFKQELSDYLNEHFNNIKIIKYYVCDTVIPKLFRVFLLSEEKLHIFYITVTLNDRIKFELKSFTELDIVWVNHSYLNHLNIINIHIDTDTDSNNFQFTYEDNNNRAEEFILCLNKLVDINACIKR